MSPAEFVNEVALPAVRDFRGDRRSRRYGYTASILVFQVKDHLRRAGVSNIEPQMRAATGDMFDVVRGVCNGAKHVRTDASHVIAFEAGADTDRPSARLGDLILGVSRLDDATGGRDVPTLGGPVDLYAAVVTTLRAFIAVSPAHLGACNASDL